LICSTEEITYMKVPVELKEAISALDHSLRWRIVELLQENDGSAYTELLELLKIPKGSLTHHLNRLMENGIIDNYSKEEFTGPYSSYYRLSSFGQGIIDGILSSIQMEPVIRTKKRPIVPEGPNFVIYGTDKYVDFKLEEILDKCMHRRMPAISIETKQKAYSSSLRTSKEIRIRHG